MPRPNRTLPTAKAATAKSIPTGSPGRCPELYDGRPGRRPGRPTAEVTTEVRLLHAPCAELAARSAYAEVVRSPAHRDDKRGTPLAILSDLLSGHRGATLTARAGAITVSGPQALLVTNNPYGMSDIAGLGHRARLDAGTLGVVAVTVTSAVRAVGLLGGFSAARRC